MIFLRTRQEVLKKTVDNLFNFLINAKNQHDVDEVQSSKDVLSKAYIVPGIR